MLLVLPFFGISYCILVSHPLIKTLGGNPPKSLVLANIEFLLLQQCQRTHRVHILWSMQSDRGSDLLFEACHKPGDEINIIVRWIVQENPMCQLLKLMLGFSHKSCLLQGFKLTKLSQVLILVVFCEYPVIQLLPICYPATPLNRLQPGSHGTLEVERHKSCLHRQMHVIHLEIQNTLITP